MKAKHIYRFGPYELDCLEQVLLHDGQPVVVPPKDLETLFVLVERAGHIVEKEELLAKVWPGVFVEEGNLAKRIFNLRQVLGDSENGKRYIETIPKRGYRFVASVQEDQQPVRPELPSPQVSERAETSASLRPRKGLWLWPLVLATGLAATAILASRYFWPPRNSPREKVMLAVLPFDNLTGDASQEYFSDGLTEEMITQLGQMNPKRLGVIARTSVMFYKHSPKPLDQIGRELGVEYVIEGSVRRDANNVRVTAQLIQVKDQTHLWARQYDRELKNLLALQGEIAQEIADEIQLSLGGQVNAANRPPVVPPVTSYEVYVLYLKGRYFWNQRTLAGFNQAAEYFQQAIAKDPNYARAYAGLADTFGLMSTWNMVPQNEFMPRARAAALKALELDDTLAEAHTSLALVLEHYDYDWQTAEKEFRRAIQLNPEYATAHQWYAEFLSRQARHDEAFRESERARQLDPISPIIASDHVRILYYSRQYDRTIEYCRAMEVSAGWIWYSYIQEGKFAQAESCPECRAEQKRLGITEHEDDPWTWAYRAYLYGRWGQTRKAQHALKKFDQLSPKLGNENDRIGASLIAYLGLPQRDKVIALLQKAYAEHSEAVATLKVDPAYDPLRADPQFQALLHRMGLDR